jgi:hypothetical protein
VNRYMGGDAKAAVGVNPPVCVSMRNGKGSRHQDEQDAQNAEEKPPRRPHVRRWKDTASDRRVHTLPPQVKSLTLKRYVTSGLRQRAGGVRKERTGGRIAVGLQGGQPRAQ